MRDYAIVTVVAGLDRAFGGPSYTVPSLAAAVARQGARGCLLTVAGCTPAEMNLPPPELVPVRLADPGLRGLRQYSGFVRNVLRETDARLVHVHGLWMPACFLAGRTARRAGLPLVVSPRGMLEPWAWQHHAWKKRPVWWLWEQWNLRQAAVLHATAAEEAQNLRRLGLRNPIAVIPNGIEMPARTEGVPARPADGTRTILFLSRIHPKKGILHLVSAWRRVRRPGWRIVVAGPDTDGHLAEIRRAAAESGVAEDFVFPGAVYGEQKWDLYRRADLFVLPTYSENFGVVVAEALAMGVPVITTTGTPWRALQEQRCGWWTDVGAEPLAAALAEALPLSDAQRREMGQRGAAFVRAEFSWDRIGRDMAAVYDWILGKGPRPGCVQELGAPAGG